MPEGGWAEPAVFDLIRNRSNKTRTRVNQGGAGSHQLRKPLVGVSRWTSDGSEWILDGEGTGYYRLRRRSLNPENAHQRSGPSGGWSQSSWDGSVVTKIDANELHRSIAFGIVDAIGGGCMAKLESGWVLKGIGCRVVKQDPALRIETLRSEIAREQENVKRARRNANHEDDVELAREYLDDARQSKAKVRELERMLLVATDANNDPEQSQQDAFFSDAEHIVRALARLANTKTKAPAALGDALKHILSDLRFEVLDGDMEVRWSVSVNLPVAEGSLVVGPIVGVLPIIANRRHWSIHNNNDRFDRMFHLFFEAGKSVPEVSDDLKDVGAGRVFYRCVDALEAKGLARQAAVAVCAAPVKVLRKTIWRVLARLSDVEVNVFSVAQLADWIREDGCLGGLDASPEWAAHVVKTYVGPAGVLAPQNWNRSVADRQAVVDAITEAGGAMKLTDLEQSLGYLRLRYQINQLTRLFEFGRTVWNPVVRFQDDVQRSTDTSSGRLHPETEVVAIDCLHCGGKATRVISAIEIPRNLLCDCGRMPIEGSPVFPREYIELPPQLTRPVRGFSMHAPSQKWKEAQEHARRVAELRGEDLRTQPKRERLWSDEQIVGAYVAGMPLISDGGLCDQAGVSINTVYKILGKYQVPRRVDRKRKSA